MIWQSIEDMEKGIYDDVDEICEAVHYRLSRKVLAKVTEDGYVEYGLQIPHNFQTRAANRSRKNSQEFDKDVEWILKGSGTVSRGSAGSVHHSLGINGASGHLYGSNVSLRRNSGSSGSIKNRSSSQSSWNRQRPIPKIRHSREDGYSQSASPPSTSRHSAPKTMFCCTIFQIF